MVSRISHFAGCKPALTMLCMSRFLCSLLAACALATCGFAQVSTWQIDPSHSAAQFTVRHLLISNVKGAFTKVSGVAQYDPVDLSKTAVEATIETASVDTRVEGRDNDLRSANFFDVAKYPTITFKSKRAEAAGNGKVKLIGDLTIHGVTREVVLDVTDITEPLKDQRGNLHVGTSATTKIKRQDFGLTYNRAVEGAAVVGDDVQITIDAELIKPAATNTAAK